MTKNSNTSKKLNHQEKKKRRKKKEGGKPAPEPKKMKAWMPAPELKKVGEALVKLIHEKDPDTDVRGLFDTRRTEDRISTTTNDPHKLLLAIFDARPEHEHLDHMIKYIFSEKQEKKIKRKNDCPVDTMRDMAQSTTNTWVGAMEEIGFPRSLKYYSCTGKHSILRFCSR